MKNIINKWRKEIFIFLFEVFFGLEILAMKEIITFPRVLGVGSFGIRTYGVLITLGVLLVTYLVGKEIKKYKETNKIDISDLLIITLIFGVLGARIYHLATDWHIYQADPMSALYIWNGGMGIFGAVLGGILGSWIYTKRKHLKLTPLIDIIAVFMPLAQVLGRTGNLINQEILGLPTNLPWSWDITTFGGSFHPVFLYEQLGNTILFLILFWLYKSRRIKVGAGKLFFVYILGYCIIRFVVEFFRIETRVLWDILSVNQIVCVFGIMISSILLFNQRSK